MNLCAISCIDRSEGHYGASPCRCAHRLSSTDQYTERRTDPLCLERLHTCLPPKCCRDPCSAFPVRRARCWPCCGRSAKGDCRLSHPLCFGRWLQGALNCECSRPREGRLGLVVLVDAPICLIGCRSPTGLLSLKRGVRIGQGWITRSVRSFVHRSFAIRPWATSFLGFSLS